ncbi:MAG: UDP-N-acetylmuramoyl-tripeptide--D-alanyl-D-alanine ligase [Zoogloeaceae bacterium]|nr:UDP-N-acetylmuramoyl-tripeptide--D-alanyl-D-alanine ligase [Zoogloeaceae bacterium]
MHWELADIAQCIGARLLGEDTAGTVAIDGVATDSRVDCAGKLFVALAGEKFDAHDYLEMAVRQGAAALLVSRAEKLPEGVPALLVADTRLALGALAAAWRSFFSLPLIALTGSNGKTTSKEMIARILEAAYEKTAEQTAETAAEQTTEQPTKQAAEQSAVLATSGNFNNDVGLPLTLLKLRPEHRAAVIEMGMSHPGEIAVLGRIARPTVALVTNAGHAHLEGMANLGAVAAEKGTIYASLPEDGLAVINEDDPYADFWRGLNRNRRVVGFSLHGKGEVNGTAEMRGLCTHLRITHHGWSVEVSLAVPGLHNAMNALAAAAAAEGALAGQVDRVAEVVRRGLTSFAGVKGRLQARPLAGGATLLDDTYNANPDSVRAGIDVLASTIGKKLLVLGDMGEIGQSSAQFHDEIGGYAKSMGIDRLYTLGENSQQAARNFGEGARHFPTPEALVAALRKDLTANATVLVKGSRFMRMERVVELLGEKD